MRSAVWRAVSPPVVLGGRGLQEVGVRADRVAHVRVGRGLEQHLVARGVVDGRDGREHDLTRLAQVLTHGRVEGAPSVAQAMRCTIRSGPAETRLSITSTAWRMRPRTRSSSPVPAVSTSTRWSSAFRRRCSASCRALARRHRFHALLGVDEPAPHAVIEAFELGDARLGLTWSPPEEREIAEARALERARRDVAQGAEHVGLHLLVVRVVRLDEVERVVRRCDRLLRELVGGACPTVLERQHRSPERADEIVLVGVVAAIQVTERAIGDRAEHAARRLRLRKRASRAAAAPPSRRRSGWLRSLKSAATASATSGRRVLAIEPRSSSARSGSASITRGKPMIKVAATPGSALPIGPSTMRLHPRSAWSVSLTIVATSETPSSAPLRGGERLVQACLDLLLERRLDRGEEAPRDGGVTPDQRLAIGEQHVEDRLHGPRRELPQRVRVALLRSKRPPRARRAR